MSQWSSRDFLQKRESENALHVWRLLLSVLRSCTGKLALPDLRRLGKRRVPTYFTTDRQAQNEEVQKGTPAARNGENEVWRARYDPALKDRG